MWGDMTSFQQVFFILAIVATVIMIVLIVMMFLGMDETDGFDVDVDDLDGIDAINDEPISGIGGLRILTIRGVLAFFSIGSWTVYLMSDAVNPFLAILFGVIAGSLAAVILAYAFKSALKLESSGNLDYKSTVGKPAMIYIRVPHNKSGRGKVIMNHQGKLIEVEALTNEDEDLLRNTKVIVEGLEDDNTLLVKKNN